jgi:LPS sulfotransferase NodH
MSKTDLLRKAVRDPRKALSVTMYKLLAPVGHRDYRRFIVLTRDRTGSNMLIQMLNSHPNVAADYEIFAKLYGQTEQSILHKAFSKQPFYIKAKGFKIFYYHPQDSDSKVVWELLQPMNDLYVIHLKRRNILRTLISSRVAYNTGIYGVRSEKEATAFRNRIQPIIYPAEQLREHFEQTRNWEKSGQKTFENHPMISIDYEDLVEYGEQTFKEVTDFIGVAFRRPRTDFKKQATQPLRSLLENYDELKSEFRGTRWGDFFDE